MMQVVNTYVGMRVPAQTIYCLTIHGAYKYGCHEVKVRNKSLNSRVEVAVADNSRTFCSALKPPGFLRRPHVVKGSRHAEDNA